jgi:phospholipase A1
MLGYMYDNGEGCEKDEAEAKKWYMLSSSGFHKRSKRKIDSDIEKQNNALLESLADVDNKETEKTMYQSAHSLFNIKAHHTNYLLPMSMKLNGDYDDSIQSRDTKSAEVEFQVSLKYDFAPNLLGFGEIYTVAYTQHSFWQRYTGDAYFRASDYNPEFFITVPLNTEYAKAIRVSVAHTSNGLGIPEERSWNYMSLSSYFQYKSLFTELQLWYRIADDHDYNPDLIETMGYGHVKFILPYEKHMLSALFRNNFNGKGAADLSYSYPLFGESLFLYIKGFVGYGESIGLYAGNPEYAGETHQKDIYVEKIGIGVGLSR